MQNDVTNILYRHWLKEQEQTSPGNLGHGRDVFVLARGSVSGMEKRENACGIEDHWDRALRWMGFEKETRDGSLDPGCEDLRLTKSAKQWALDIVKKRWGWLEDLDGVVRKEIEKMDEGKEEVA